MALYIANYLDNRKHKSPHIHVRYQERSRFAIPEGDILEGNLPGSKMKLVQAWMKFIGMS
jgi:hypothetical protein